MNDANPQELLGTWSNALEDSTRWTLPVTCCAAVGAAAAYYLLRPTKTNIPGPSYDFRRKFAQEWQDGTQMYRTGELMDEYKTDVIQVWIVNRRIIVTCEPQLMAVMIKDRDAFCRWDSTKEAIGVVSDSALFLMDGEKWRNHRTVLVKAFTQKAIRHANLVAIDQCKDKVAQWQDGEVINATVALHNLAFSVFCEAFFSYRPGAQDLQKLVTSFITLLKGFHYRLGKPKWLWWLLVEDVGDIGEAKSVLERLMHRVLEEKKQGAGSGNDMLDIMLTARMHDGQAKLTDKEVTDEILSFFIVGSETTSNVLMFALRYLSKHPNIQQKLLNEIDRVLGTSEDPTLEKLAEMPYLGYVARETLRLEPTVFIIAREARRDYSYRDMVIRKGDVCLSWVERLHRDPKYFEDPNAFKPERWATEAEWLVPGTYMPFGDGAHKCIAERFALVEIKTVLATILGKFKVVPATVEEKNVPTYVFTKTLRDHPIRLEDRRSYEN